MSYNKRVEIADPETGEIHGLNVGMLVGDVRDLLLSKRRMQIEATVWSRLSEDQQTDEINAATQLAEDLVEKVVEMVASAGNEVIHAMLDNFKVKDGTVTLTAKGIADDGAVLALNHIGKKALKIVVADADQFDEQREDVTPMPDQNEMFPDGDDDSEMSDQDIDDIAAEMDDGLDEMEEPDDLHDEPASDEQVEGYHARMSGQHSQRNPYDMETEAREEWYLGWKKADDGDEALPEIEEWPPADEEKESGDAPETDENDADQQETAPETPDLPPEKAGQQARLTGAGSDENPYDGGTEEHQAWAHAYHAADVEIKGIIDNGAKAAAEGKTAKDCPWKKGTDAEGFWMQGFNSAVDGDDG